MAEVILTISDVKDALDIDYDEVSIFEAESPTNRKLDYIIYNDGFIAFEENR